MFKLTRDGFSITLSNDQRVDVYFDGRIDQRYVRAEIYSPGGSLADAGHYSADHFAEMLARISQQASGWTPEELTELRKIKG